MYLCLLKNITLNIIRNLEVYKYSVIQKYQVLIHLSPYFEAYVFHYEKKSCINTSCTQSLCMFLVLSLQSLKMKLAKLMNVLFSRRLVPFYASQPLYVLLKFFSSLLYEMEYVVNLCNFDYCLRYVSFEYLWTRWF